MSNGTVAAILGTVIGLGAGTGGMVVFGNTDDGLAEDFTTINKSNTKLSREKDELEGDLAGLENELRKVREELKNAKLVADEFASERDDNPNDEAANASKTAIEATDAKTASDEALRQANAKIDVYEDLMLENGIYGFLTPEELEARRTELRSSFDVAIAGKDKKVAMDALKELQKLGPKFFKEAIEMWNVMAADYGSGENWGKGTGELGMSMMEFVSLVPNFEMIAAALSNPNADPTFRASMLFGLAWRTEEDAGKRTELAGNVLLSGSNNEARGAIQALGSIKDPSSVRYLSDYISSNTDNAESRADAVRALQRKDTPEAWAAIEDAANNDTDPKVKKAASDALATKNVAVAGLLINWVGEDGQASLVGIKLGDIMTKYNGQTIRKVSDISEAKKTVKDGQSVKVVLYRGGKYITLTIGPGQIGINGTEVKPKK
ncbi:MAG: HEAT repeat domain-containing protein [Planctomycetes bacterium]|nr:HEAT repeat domain-containing protein [Planctomycetota bacterium]